MAFTASTALFGVAKAAGSPLLGKVLASWRGIVITILLCIVFYQNTFDNRVFFWADTIPYLRTLVHEQEEQLKLVANANEMLSNVIETNNQRVEEFRKVTEQLEQDKLSLNTELEEIRGTAAQEVIKILRVPTPATCEAAVDFLRNSIPNLQYDMFRNLDKKQ